ncbi:MAG: 2-aminoethylphosphonate aminotransferase, partial [Nitrospiraceae bacterium]
EMAEVADSLNRVFVLDSVNGLGGEELDVAGPHLYMVAGSSHDCLQGVPGVSFVLVRKGFMERMKAYPKRSWYLHLPYYYEDAERGRSPVTPAVQVFRAFDEALNELLEEGVAARIRRYKHASALIRKKMGELGMKPLLPAEFQSNSLTAYHLPDGVAYQTLHDKLKEQGYVIAPGLGPFEGKIFRVANMGALTEQQIGGFLAAFQSVMKTLAAC